MHVEEGVLEGTARGSRGALDRWFASVPGRQILAAEARLLDELLPDLFGFHALQVGQLGDVDLLAASRIPSALVVDLDGRVRACAHPVVRGTPTALPIESDGVDLVLLPHVLEFETKPHDALRESFRVLVAEGHLVVCGFNPWSLLGCWRMFRRRPRPAPWGGHFLAFNRMKDWLALLGFDLIHHHACFFKPPIGNERVMRRLEFLEAAGQRAIPFFAGAYVLVARKRVTTLTPIRPRWRRPRRRLAVVGLAGGSVRVAPDG